MSSSLFNDYAEWRRAALAKLPSLAQRVFNLRDMPYENQAYQDSLEMRLGGLIKTLNANSSSISPLTSISNRAMFAEIDAEVTKAESQIFEAFECGRRAGAPQPASPMMPR